MDSPKYLHLNFFASMHFSHAVIRLFALIGLTAVTVEFARESLFLERLLILGAAVLVWWYICHKTPLKRKA